MTILTMPPLSRRVAELRWQLLSNTQTFRSPLTGAEKRAELAGARWGATLVFRDRDSTEHRAWMVFLAKLRGAAGSCYLPLGWAFPRLGAGGGTPLVKGAGQTGTTLTIDGATPNVTGWMRAGDYFSFDTSAGRELHLVTSDVDTSADGEATITFEPPIRTAPNDNATVEITDPSATMRLVDDNQALWTFRALRSDATFQFVEAFPS